ncbi:MAG: DUF4870 domain-containing protein [Anaerolineae bacterium]|nr:DUF4870 domain-containing protein [Anaerolineae bacterium]
MNEKPHSVEERLVAALTHGSVIVQGLGILAGVLVYLNQREKSRYAAFQALQAAVYQLITTAIIIVVWVLWTIFYFLTFIPLIGLPEDAAPPPIFWIGLISMVIPMVLMGAFWLYGLAGALATWRGREFRYPVIGAALERAGLWRDAPAPTPE